MTDDQLKTLAKLEVEVKRSLERFYGGETEGFLLPAVVQM